MAAVLRWSGREARALRQARRMSVRAFAEHLGVAPASITNWERRGELARLRTETQQLLDIDLDRASAEIRQRFEVTLAALVDRRPKGRGRDGVQLDLARDGNPAGWTGLEQQFDRCSISDDISSDTVRAMMFAFRQADQQVGGGPLYPAVVMYLKSHIGPQLLCGGLPASETDTFSAASSMLEMAGWMAHDCGDDIRAEAHFDRALVLTALVEDHHLQAQILGSMSHLKAHLGKPHKAIAYAHEGQSALRRAASVPMLKSRLLALEARGAAMLGNRSESLRLLARAETELARDSGAIRTNSPWVSHYDEASFANDAGRCLRRLEDTSGVRAQAERIIALRPAQRARSRCLGHLMLAQAFISGRAMDEASEVIMQTLNSNVPIHSAPVSRGLRSLRQALTPFRDSGKVAEACDRMDDVLQGVGLRPTQQQGDISHKVI